MVFKNNVSNKKLLESPRLILTLHVVKFLFQPPMTMVFWGLPSQILTKAKLVRVNLSSISIEVAVCVHGGREPTTFVQTGPHSLKIHCF